MICYLQLQAGENSIHLNQHLIIPKAHNLNSVRIQIICTFSIILFSFGQIMLSAIQFYRKFFIWTEKIQNIWAKAVLTKEF